MKRANNTPEKWPAPSSVRRSQTPPSSPSSSSSRTCSSDTASPLTSSASPSPAIAAPPTSTNGRYFLRPRPPRTRTVPVVPDVTAMDILKNKTYENLKKFFYGGDCYIKMYDIFKYNSVNETNLPELSRGKCMFCRVLKTTHACIPCGHKVLCSDCRHKVAFCPLCQRAINSMLHIFD